jgi:hypothetical protein
MTSCKNWETGQDYSMLPSSRMVKKKSLKSSKYVLENPVMKTKLTKWYFDSYFTKFRQISIGLVKKAF